jgi:hypothetical protein
LSRRTGCHHGHDDRVVVRFEFNTTGVDRASGTLFGAADRASNLRPAFNRIADEWISSERRQFASRKGWTPLAESTLERKRRLGQPLTRMRATGALERGLTVRRMPGQTIRLNRQSMTVGLKPNGKLFYGRFQEKVVVFDKLAERRVQPIIHDYIVHGSKTTRAR